MAREFQFDGFGIVSPDPDLADVALGTVPIDIRVIADGDAKGAHNRQRERERAVLLELEPRRPSRDMRGAH